MQEFRPRVRCLRFKYSIHVFRAVIGTHRESSILSHLSSEHLLEAYVPSFKRPGKESFTSYGEIGMKEGVKHGVLYILDLHDGRGTFGRSVHWDPIHPIGLTPLCDAVRPSGWGTPRPSEVGRPSKSGENIFRRGK